MKNLAVFIISIVSVIMGSCTLLLASNYFQSVNAITNYTKYSNATNGLTFEYPSEWLIKYFESNGQTIEITNPDGHNGIIIRIPDVSTQIIMMRYSSLEEAANNVIGKMYGMNITEPFTEKIINGLPAAMGKVSGDVPLDSGTIKQIAQLAWIYHLGTIYSLQYHDVDNKFNSVESQDIMNRFIRTLDISEYHTDVTAESNQSLIFVNHKLGYNLEYPANWLKEESQGEPTFISPRLSPFDKAPESIAVTSEVLFPIITLEEFTDVAMSLLRSDFQNMKLIKSSDVTLADYPAHQIVYTYTLEGVNLKNLQIWTVSGDRAYVLTYGALPEEFDDSLPVIQNMIDSFVINEIQ